MSFNPIIMPCCSTILSSVFHAADPDQKAEADQDPAGAVLDQARHQRRGPVQNPVMMRKTIESFHAAKSLFIILKRFSVGKL
jgi:hypothetical protein